MGWIMMICGWSRAEPVLMFATGTLFCGGKGMQHAKKGLPFWAMLAEQRGREIPLAFSIIMVNTNPWGSYLLNKCIKTNGL